MNQTTTAPGTTASPTTTTGSSWSLTDRRWEPFRCRKCQRVLFKHDDGHHRRVAMIVEAVAQMDRAVAEGRMDLDLRNEIAKTYNQDETIEIKCTLTACKTMNYHIVRFAMLPR